MNTRRSLRVITLVALVVLVPATGTAQRMQAAWRRTPPAATSWRAAADTTHPLVWLPSTPAPRTHARAGAIIGGVVGGFLGAVTGLGLCHFDDPCPHPAGFVAGGFVLGALAGGGVGARIGGWFEHRAAPAASVPSRASVPPR